MSFEGKSVMITGAGKGIGRETARFLASKGASIVALPRTLEDLDSLRDEIGGTMIAVDLADAWEVAMRAVYRPFLALDQSRLWLWRPSRPLSRHSGVVAILPPGSGSFRSNIPLEANSGSGACRRPASVMFGGF